MDVLFPLQVDRSPSGNPLAWSCFELRQQGILASVASPGASCLSSSGSVSSRSLESIPGTRKSGASPHKRLFMFVPPGRSPGGPTGNLSTFSRGTPYFTNVTKSTGPAPFRRANPLRRLAVGRTRPGGIRFRGRTSGLVRPCRLTSLVASKSLLRGGQGCRRASDRVPYEGGQTGR